MNPNLLADAPERDEKAARDLDRGQWIEVVDEEGETWGDARVLHVEPYIHELLGRRVKLLFGRPGYDPEILDFDAEMQLELLTDDEIDAALDGERRELIATELEQLAELMRQTTTPLPHVWRSITVGIDLGQDVEAMKQAAEALGVPMTGSGSMVSVMRDRGLDSGAGVAVQFYAYRPKPDAIPRVAEPDPLGLAYTRADDEPDDPTPVSPARAEPHAGSVLSGIAEDGHKLGAPVELAECGAWCSDGPGGLCTKDRGHDGAHGEGGLVDETPVEPVTVYFSFGHGQSDPDTGKNLIDHYVTIVGPSYEACRAAMFASRFGQAWAFDYDPASPQWLEWGPQWTEHEVINAMPDETGADPRRCWHNDLDDGLTCDGTGPNCGPA